MREWKQIDHYLKLSSALSVVHFICQLNYSVCLLSEDVEPYKVFVRLACRGLINE